MVDRSIGRRYEKCSLLFALQFLYSRFWRFLLKISRKRRSNAVKRNQSGKPRCDAALPCSSASPPRACARRVVPATSAFGPRWPAPNPRPEATPPKGLEARASRELCSSAPPSDPSRAAHRQEVARAPTCRPGPPRPSCCFNAKGVCSYKRAPIVPTRAHVFRLAPRASPSAVVHHWRRRWQVPPPPTQSSSRPTTLDSPLGSPRTLAVGFCSIVAAVSPEFEPQCPLPPCAFDPVHQSIPDQNFSHPSNLCELNFMLVPFVCLDGPHITTGEFPVAVKGLDVRESCLEGTFVKNKIFPGTQCN
jgi:hypothetical protein